MHAPSSAQLLIEVLHAVMQRTPLARRFHLPLQGKLPPSQVQSRQQIQCKFKRDEHQEGDSIFPQAQVLNKTALRKYPKVIIVPCLPLDWISTL